LDAGRCILETAASSYEYLAMGLAWLGADFEVEEPPELTKEIQRIARRFTRAVKKRK
jgi:predicted DNA-binding transcriptional regulator YafY